MVNNIILSFFAKRKCSTNNTIDGKFFFQNRKKTRTRYLPIFLNRIFIIRVKLAQTKRHALTVHTVCVRNTIHWEKIVNEKSLSYFLVFALEANKHFSDQV